MQRDYKKRALFDKRRLGIAVFTLFIAFVAYKILTPPSTEVARVPSPDGTKTARLRKIYYVSRPSYKIDYRKEGKLLWLNLRLTNTTAQTTGESLEWSSDSGTLHFKINGTHIWSHVFDE